MGWRVVVLSELFYVGLKIFPNMFSPFLEMEGGLLILHFYHTTSGELKVMSENPKCFHIV